MDVLEKNLQRKFAQIAKFDNKKVVLNSSQQVLAKDSVKTILATNISPWLQEVIETSSVDFCALSPTPRN